MLTNLAFFALQTSYPTSCIDVKTELTFFIYPNTQTLRPNTQDMFIVKLEK